MKSLIQGRVNQVLGPFDTSDLLGVNGAITKAVPESDPPRLIKLGIQASEGTIVNINGANIRIGKTGIYELDNTVQIISLYFPTPGATDASTIVDFIY